MTFEEFVAVRLSGLLRYAAVLTGDRDLAQDVVQEALARAAMRWRRISAMDRPELYVRRIVTNQFLSSRRRRRPALVPFRTEVHDQPGSGPDLAEVHAERDAMTARLATLSRQHRAVLVLRYYEGLSDNEIAQVLGCSPSTVRSHASRAIARLRDNDLAASHGAPAVPRRSR